MSQGQIIGWACLIAVLAGAGVDIWNLFYTSIVRLESPLYARLALEYIHDPDQLGGRVVLEVVDTPPELKGGTATKRPKPAKLSTGLEIMVPEYIGNGEKVWVNTTTGEFAGRAD